MRRFAEEIVTNFDVRTPSLDVQVRYLSGGNLQKIVLGRELSKEHKLLIAHNPTRGLDVGEPSMSTNNSLNKRTQE